MLFSITPGFIHITSILETEEEVKFLKNYIQCLFKGSVIGISCFKFTLCHFKLLEYSRRENI